LRLRNHPCRLVPFAADAPNSSEKLRHIPIKATGQTHNIVMRGKLSEDNQAFRSIKLKQLRFLAKSIAMEAAFAASSCGITFGQVC